MLYKEKYALFAVGAAVLFAVGQQAGAQDARHADRRAGPISSGGLIYTNFSDEAGRCRASQVTVTHLRRPGCSLQRTGTR